MAGLSGNVRVCGCAGVRVLHATCLPTAMGWERDMNISLVVFNREEGAAEAAEAAADISCASLQR